MIVSDEYVGLIRSYRLRYFVEERCQGREVRSKSSAKSGATGSVPRPATMAQ